jgi:hypothetical protein
LSLFGIPGQAQRFQPGRLGIGGSAFLSELFLDQPVAQFRCCDANLRPGKTGLLFVGHARL